MPSERDDWLVSGLALRAIGPADDAFLRALYRSVRDPELALTAWSDAEKDAFANQQFDLQDRWYRQHYEGAELLVIEREGAAIGRIYIFESENELRVMDIALVPAARNAGLGTLLLRHVQQRAAARAAAVTLHVELFNPARALYARLGFREGEAEGVYSRMRWDPPLKAG